MRKDLCDIFFTDFLLFHWKLVACFCIIKTLLSLRHTIGITFAVPYIYALIN